MVQSVGLENTVQIPAGEVLETGTFLDVGYHGQRGDGPVDRRQERGPHRLPLLLRRHFLLQHLGQLLLLGRQVQGERFRDRLFFRDVQRF